MKRTNLINELSQRVYQKIAEQQLTGLLMEGKPLMTGEELKQHITDNLDEYLSPEEQRKLLADNLFNTDDENIKSLTMEFAIEMAAAYVQLLIKIALSNKNFIGNNPFSVHSNPQMFTVAKYFDEELGVKIRFWDSGLTAHI
jgi:hypothetical protein